MSPSDQSPIAKQVNQLKTPVVGRLLLNMAIIAIAYFVVTGGGWNFLFVLFAAGLVSASNRIYAVIQSRFPWAFWVLLAFGGLIVGLGLYRAFS
jgi:hypothetical protein